MVSIQQDISLAGFTTIGLGGQAAFFATCNTVDEIREALTYAKEHNLEVHILGGGSNTIFSDEGFSGLVLHIAMQGITFTEDTTYTYVQAAAGHVWDDVVVQVIVRGLAGIECLSGIPGLVGAAPMQNIGAYGQEVAETIQLVHVLHKETLEESIIKAADCNFAYRMSVFKENPNNPYIVTGVTFALRNDGAPVVRYEQVIEALQKKGQADGAGKEALQHVRECVLELRKGKSMVLDANDPNTKSCGSFFVNPIVPKEKLMDLEREAGIAVPHFPADTDTVKLSAAWLIEQAGFSKGYREGGVGISQNHSLALVNYGGTTTELLHLAQSITERVENQFGITLVQEPVVIPYTSAVQ